MTIPTPTFPEVHVMLERVIAPYYLTDSDGVPLVDVDGERFALGRLPFLVEITERVLSGSVDLGDVQAIGSSHAGVDASVQVLSLSLDGGEPSLMPGVESPWNLPDDALRTYRRVTVEARADRDQEPITLFVGYLGDEMRAVMNAQDTSISVRARDQAKAMQDRFIADWPILAASATPASPVSIMDVLHEMLELLPVERRPVLIDSYPAFSIRYPYRPQNQSVWDAAQQLTRQAGGVLRFIGYDLHLVLPPRPIELNVTPPDERRYAPDDVFIDDLGRTDTDVRNVVTVVYRDGATGERQQAISRDQWSVDNITGGIEKASILEVDATSQIDTLAEAQQLADRFISDMSREFVSTQLTLPFSPHLNLFDVVEIANPRVGHRPRRFAIHSIRHAWSGATYRTIIAGVSQVVGRRRSWLDLEPRAGSPNDPRGPHQTLLPAPDFALFRDFAGFSLVISGGGVGVDRYEIHWSTTPAFTPSAATVRASGPQRSWSFRNFLDPNAPDFITIADHYVRVRAMDERGNAGPYSAEQSVTPGIAGLIPLGDNPIEPAGGDE